MIYVGFYPHLLNSATIVGTPFTSRGIVYGVNARGIESQRNAALLTWAFQRDQTHKDNIVFLVHVNGVYEQKESDTQAIVGNLANDQPFAFDVMPTTGIEENTVDETNIFYKANRGNKILFSWVKNVESDFEKYVIFSDNGREDGVTDTKIAEVNGRENTTYLTDELDEKTYTFRITYQDDTGNIDTVDGPARIVTINSYPKAPENNVIVYDQVSRKATLTATVPAGQDADVVGYVAYSNYVPGFGFHTNLCLENWLRLAAVVDVAGAITFETHELAEVNYRFCIRAIDKSGAESDFTELKLSLVKSGGELIEGPLEPDQPEMIDAEAKAGGQILLKARLVSLTDVTALRPGKTGLQSHLLN